MFAVSPIGTSAPPAPSTIQREESGSARTQATSAVEVDRPAAQSRRQMRRHRPFETHAGCQELVRAARGQPRDLGRVVVLFDAGLNRLPIPQGKPAAISVEERRRRHRLADAGVGAGYEEAAEH